VGATRLALVAAIGMELVMQFLLAAMLVLQETPLHLPRQEELLLSKVRG
jgi:hypothetical protein